jgi:DNA-directed RNA polymerase subunit M/transcription elongation factor TFIIS
MCVYCNNPKKSKIFYVYLIRSFFGSCFFISCATAPPLAEKKYHWRTSLLFFSLVRMLYSCSGLYSRYPSVGADYKNKFRELCGAFRDLGARIESRLANGELKCAQLVAMSTAELIELNADAQAKLVELQAYMASAARSDISLQAINKVETSEFTCPRCQATRAGYYQKQIQPGDEPMTIFITCYECGKEWQE